MHAMAIIWALTHEGEESVHALVLHYSRCLSMIQDQVFGGVANPEQQDISDKSNRDKALLSGAARLQFELLR